jgi:hypothetical protein
MNDVLYKTKELLERKLGESVSSGNIPPQELDCVYKAVKTLGQIATIYAMERAQWEKEESRRMSRAMSQGMPYDATFTDPYYMRDSMARNRNAMGQFTSRESGQGSNSYNQGYSGHSVNDIMIQSLERAITPDMSEMERQRIMEQIRMIRERKD